MTAQAPILDIRELTVDFKTRRGIVRAIEGVSLRVHKQKIVGIVGESGSGKSVTSFATMRILDRAGGISSGSIVYFGKDVVTASKSEMYALRGGEMSMVFQNPRAALNPIRSIGDQLEDVLLAHGQATKRTVRDKAIEALEQVRIPRPSERYHAYPFELSGGMCQRVVIALALACRPQLLIADEPTTGLDTTTQKAVMDLIVELTRARSMSAILITHDLGLAATYCDEIVVMEKGKVVETGQAEQIFANPRHPYTRKLVQSTPRVGLSLRELLPVELRTEPMKVKDASRLSEPLLSVKGLVKEFAPKGDSLWRKVTGHQATPPFRAVSDINFEVKRGESVGLVGESGCGKSTTSLMVMRLIDPTAGQIMFDGEDLATIPASKFATHAMRGRIQMVFQDPTDSLNPRYTAARSMSDLILQTPGGVRGDALRARCEELARLVGLPVDLLDRLPHQLSGGQKSRVGIARAIALNPDLVVLDEPTAALDVSVQAVVLNLLQDLKAALGMSYLFVSHDLNVVRLLCDRVIVMQSGSIVDQGSVSQVLDLPTHPYTRSLLDAIPHPPAMNSGSPGAAADLLAAS